MDQRATKNLFISTVNKSHSFARENESFYAPHYGYGIHPNICALKIMNSIIDQWSSFSLVNAIKRLTQHRKTASFPITLLALRSCFETENRNSVFKEYL